MGNTSSVSSVDSLRLVGNKNDLGQFRQVSVNEAKEYALGVQASLIEVSAKSGKNVESAFEVW